MRFVATELPGVILVEPPVHRDARGFFLEAYHEPRYRANGIALPFVQDNHSLSRRGTLRLAGRSTPTAAMVSAAMSRSPRPRSAGPSSGPHETVAARSGGPSRA